jgi:glycosyltransferase involved in cell wall biosynthesis
MSQTKLSVNIITYNEAHNLKDCLESIRWADEVVVVDSHSTDGTIETCLEYGAKIYQEDFKGYGRLRNIAIEKSSHDWILSLDADERVTAELKEEILREFDRGPSADAYAIPRKSHFLGRWIWSCGWYPDYRSTQLFQRKAGRYTDILNDDHFEPLPAAGKDILKTTSALYV